MTCQKIAYSTAGEAREAAREISKNKAGRLRVYRCRDGCDAYHLTSWSKATERQRRKSLRQQFEASQEEAS